MPARYEPISVEEFSAEMLEREALEHLLQHLGILTVDYCNGVVARPGLAGRVALITAATGGIGLQIATRLATARAELIISARNPARTEAVVKAIISAVPGT